MTSFEYIQVSIEDHIAVLSINRPPVNALNLTLLDEFINALKQMGDDKNVRVIVISSALNSVFCAGLDLEVIRGKSGLELRGFLEKLYIELYTVQHRLGKPTIAAVRGAARAGGMTIAVSCDMIVAGRSSTFGYPEINVGLVPAIHFVLLPRIIGRHKAFEFLFRGESFTSEEAEQMGIVNRVVDDDAVLEMALSLAGELASKSPVIMKLGRDAFLRTNDLDYRRSIENVVETMAVMIETADSREAIEAFVEKRSPKYE